VDTSKATVKLIGAALSGDRAAGEKAERDLDTLIAKRDKARRSDEAEQAREDLYAESVRRFSAARDAELREQWFEYHQGQEERHRANLEALVAYHGQEAQRYLPKGAA
jgi:hypothetical protein